MSFPIPSNLDIAKGTSNRIAPWKISPQLAHRIELKPDTNLSTRKCLLLKSDLEIDFVKKYFSQDKPKGMRIKRVYLIDHTASNQAFESHLSQMEKEAKKPQFSPSWRTEPFSEARNEIFQKWEALTQQFSSLQIENEKSGYSQAKVLPLWLRGDSEEGSSILNNLKSSQTSPSFIPEAGIQPLGSYQGVFGNGTYFTNSARYAFLHNPTYLLLAWVAMREPYPVLHDQFRTESGDRELLNGKRGYQNYNAYHIPVALIDSFSSSYDDYACYQNQDANCDEFVVFNQAQIINRFWIQLEQAGSELSYSFEEAMVSAEEGDLTRLQVWLDEDPKRLREQTLDGENLLYAALLGNQPEIFKAIYSRDLSLVHQLRNDGKSLCFLSVLGAREEILLWMMKQGLKYSPIQFKGEAKTFGYSESRIDQALKSVGWSIRGIPPHPNYFTERTNLLSQLKIKFAESPYQTFCQVSLVGPGGMGKSTLAKFYANQAKDIYSSVFWVENTGPLQSCLKNLGIKFGIVGAEIPEENYLDEVILYLKKNPGWLLIFDNFEDFSSLDSVFSGFKGGHILATSRDDSAPHQIQVGSFSSKESTLFFSRYTGQQDEEGAKVLAEELGHLPLALTQAAAYIFENCESYRSYLNLYLKERKEVISLRSDHEEYPYSAATTWKISVDKLSQSNPNAISVLNRAFYLASDAIPKCLLGSTELPSETLESSLESLRKYGLLTSGSEPDTFSIHKLIQTSLRDRLSATEEEESISTIRSNLMREWLFDRDDPATWKESSYLVPHLKRFCQFETSSEDLSLFLFQLRKYFLRLKIDLDETIRLCLQSLEIEKSFTDPKHVFEEKSVAILTDLGLAYQNKGELSKAIESYQRALSIAKGLHGETQPYFATILASLGAAYKNKGDFSTGISLLDESLAISKKFEDSFRPTHFAIILNNLGTAKLDQGKLDEAISYLNQAIEIRKMTEEAQHPDIAVPLANLGQAYQKKKDLNKAAACLHESLEIERRFYGENHLSLVVALNSLGSLYQDKKELLKATEFYQEALKITETICGKEDERVGTLLQNLGTVYYYQNKLSEAFDHYERALEIFEKVPDKNPLEIAKTTRFLANNYLEINQLERSSKYFLKLIEVLKRVYGENDEKIGHIFHQLALIHLSEQSFEASIGYIRESLKILRKNLKDNDPKIKDVLQTLKVLQNKILHEKNISKKEQKEL